MIRDLTLKVRLLSPTAKMPAYATDLAAGLDLCASPGDGVWPWMFGFVPGQTGGHDHTVLGPGDRAVIKTGIAVAIPEGFEGQIRPRSGLSKRGIAVALGTIDADYTGELGVLVENRSDDVWYCMVGDRIAQLVISPVARASLVQVEELPKTERGAGGWGSTGVR